MRRIVSILIVAILIAVMSSGCTSNSEITNSNLQISSEFFHFRVIEKGGMEDGNAYRIIVDDDTEVLYLYTHDAHHATMTPILNSDGTPKLLSDFDTTN